MANLSSTRIFGDGTVERSLYVKQRLGVGVGNPSAKVQADSSGSITGSGDLSNANFLSGNTSQGIGIDNNEITQNGGDLFLSATSGNIQFRTNSGTERMRIESGGNVGIGTTSPSEKQEVAGVEPTIRVTNTKSDYGDSATQDVAHGALDFYLEESSGDGPGVHAAVRAMNEGDFADRLGLGFFTGTASPATERVRIRNNGNVGIGTTSPSQKLDVNGQVEAQDYYIREDNLWLGDHVDNDDAHHPDHRDGIDYIDFNNKEQSDYNTDGRLYWDLSAGLYIKSSNANTNSPEVLWSRANVGAGSNISISYDSEGEPTIDTRVNHTISTNAPSGGSDGDVWFVV